MSRPSKPPLRVIAGAGCQGAPSRASLALALETALPHGMQLALPGLIPSCVVISVSPAALFTLDLAEVLRVHRARHIVDIRLAVEFGSLGLSRRQFDAIVGRLGIAYRHFTELANNNYDLTWNPTAMWNQFRRQLRRERLHPALLRLRDTIDDGPVVLISESPYHEESERRLVVEALHEIRPGFAMTHIDPST